MMLVGLNSGLRIANETAITKEGSRRLRSDSESHTTSLLNNRECNYRQSSVIVCSLLLGLRSECNLALEIILPAVCTLTVSSALFSVPSN